MPISVASIFNKLLLSARAHMCVCPSDWLAGLSGAVSGSPFVVSANTVVSVFRVNAMDREK
jgi:hypothetical protein